MINNSILFLPGYYTHSGALLFLVLIIPTVNTKIIPIDNQTDILSNQILKRSLAEKINKFLIILEKIWKKKYD